MSVFVALGPHIVDVLGRPVTHIPDGQGSAPLTELAITVAGTAGGTAVDLARLGGSVRSVGAIGDDALGQFLRSRLHDYGVDTASLVEVAGVPTSGTILPIRPNGERPALHMPGATAHLRSADLRPGVLDGADYVHVGGPETLGSFVTELPALLERARAVGTVVSADLLSTGSFPGLLDALRPVFALVDHLLINDQQAMNLTGAGDPDAAALALLETGPEHVVVTCGADGGVLASADGTWRFPALTVQVIDTTGCGDAFSAGYLIGLSKGLQPVECCGWGTCAAAMVAQVLGSDGITGADAVEALLSEQWEAALRGSA